MHTLAHACAFRQPHRSAAQSARLDGWQPRFVPIQYKLPNWSLRLKLTGCLIPWLAVGEISTLPPARSLCQPCSAA